ncbi:MAG: high-affinity branched-chain amino acid ABC transporter permease LivM [Alphaproteobacteria bacterium]|nr:high-affinity branched-chain amino acid ABC transporter permease LivM [Alphaproteobacteria bacterium]
MAETVTETTVAAAAARQHGALRRKLIEALVAGLVAFLLSVPMFAFRTTDAPGGLVIESRWSLVAVLVALAFVGKLAFSFIDTSRLTSAAGRSDTVTSALSTLFNLIGPALIAFAIILPFLPFSDRYIMDLAILVLTYVMLGWGLNIVVGLAGLLDLGYVAFYAVGAYSYALLAQHFGFSFWICLPLAGILAAFWGIILGFPVLRLRGDYLAIVTLAFGEIIRIVLLNWYQFTGGPDGLSRIPRPSFFGLEFKRFGEGSFHEFFGLDYSSLHRIVFLYYIILVLALITNWVTIRMRRLPIGRAWEAMREDEIACKSLGINTVTTKLSAFAIGAMFGGFAGSFFATKQGFISPESFVFLESAIILAIVVLGGMGSQIGVAIAAIVLIGGLEYLRDVTFLKVIFGEDFDPKQWRMVIFGFLMVTVMVWRPRGLISGRTPSIALKERRAIGSDLVKEGHG